MEEHHDRGQLEARKAELLDHADMLFRYALTRTGDRQTAEDLVQDTLLTALSKISSFEGRSSMSTWLIGILRHKILDHIRWRSRHPGDLPNARDDDSSGGDDVWFSLSGAWRVDPNVGLEVLDETPERILERSELRIAILHCVDGLPPGLHRIYVLRELEEQEPQDVCEVTGVTRGSLAVLLHRARQSLRRCLQALWGTP